MAIRLRGTFNLFWLIYVLVGIFVAWTHDYITIDLLRRIGSALLAIFLWVLVLLGINLHIPAKRSQAKKGATRPSPAPLS